MTDHLKSAPVAYDNEAFLHSPDGRIIRMLAEYQEPLARFRREQIQDTVVFFGSARFQGHKAAAENLAAVGQNNAAEQAAQFEQDLKRAQANVDMARYYEDARQLAYMGFSDSHHRPAAAICHSSRGCPTLVSALLRGQGGDFDFRLRF